MTFLAFGCVLDMALGSFFTAKGVESHQHLDLVMAAIGFIGAFTLLALALHLAKEQAAPAPAPKVEVEP